MFTTVESYFQGFAGRKRSLEAFINSIIGLYYYLQEMCAMKYKKNLW